MRRLLFFLLILPATMWGQDIWLQKDSVNGAPRSVASTFVVLNEGFIIGGLDTDGFRRKMYSYSYFQDDWDDELSLGGLNGDGLERGSASSFSIQNKGYVCLGQGVTNGFYKDLWEYDPVSKIWTQKADFIGSPRRQACSFVLNDEGYVGTGSDQNGLCNDFYKYDPSTNSWTQVADFAGTARKEAVAFTMGGHGYLGTGDDGVKRKDFWRYSADLDAWEQLADFPGTPRKGAVGWGDFPQGFICCGEDINNDYMNDLWEYNYFGNSWTQRASIPGPGRTNAAVFQLNGFAFVGTGYNGDFLDDMWAYQRILSVDNANTDKVTLYPNPSSGVVTCKNISGDAHVTLTDMSGRNVTALVDIERNWGHVTINRNALISGSYLINIYDPKTGSSYTNTLIFQ